MRQLSFSALCLLYCTVSSVHADIGSIELLNGQTFQLPIVTGEIIKFYLDISKLPFLPSHIVFQAHTQWYQVRVSFDDDGYCGLAASGRSTVGTSVGLVSLSAARDPVHWCLSPITQHSATTFKVMVMALVYKSDDPIPGGCNLELSLENDPNLYLTTSASQTRVQFAYGNLNIADVRQPCGSSSQRSELIYEVYQMYLTERHFDEDTFFATVARMLKADDVTASSRLLTTASDNNVKKWLSEWSGMCIVVTGGVQITRKAKDVKTLVDFAAYYGQGVVYAVVIRVSNGSSISPGVAAYVPAVTYSCNFTQDQCVGHDSIVGKITVGILGCVGLLLCFAGHRLFPLELYVFGHLSSHLTVYILTVRWSAWTELVCLYVSLGAGCVGGLLWLLLWVVVGSPPLSMALAGLCLGYVISCIIFLATPLTLYDLFLHEYFYQSMFFIVVCLVAVIFIAASVHKLSLLACAVIGVYLFLLTIDWFLIGSGVQQMVLNSIRKSAIPGFTGAYVTVPYQIADIALYSLWGVLAVAGFFVQLYMERNRPQFPEPPQHRRRRTEPRADALPTQRPRTEHGADAEQSERQPLLSAAALARHASLGMEQPTADAWHSVDTAPTSALHDPPPPYS